MQNPIPNGPQVFPRRENRPEPSGAPEPTAPRPRTQRDKASGAARLRTPKSPLRGALAGASLRARALTAGEIERSRTKHEERLHRTAELQRQRDELVHQMFAVLNEKVSLEAIALPEDPMARPFLVLTVEADGMRFSVSDYPVVNRSEGSSRLKVFLTCSQCGDGDWHAVSSLSALGNLLSRVEDASISEACSTCLMTLQFEGDPFRDE